MNFAIGDKVGYVSRLGDSEFQHVGKVRDVIPDGIPSCKKPLLMLDGKSGVVLATHCVKIPEGS